MKSQNLLKQIKKDLFHSPIRNLFLVTPTAKSLSKIKIKNSKLNHASFSSDVKI